MNIRMITLIALAVLVTAGAASAAYTMGEIEMRGTVVEVVGSHIIPAGGGTASTSYAWNPYNFAAFWYYPDDDLKSEELTIAAINDRTIAKDNLYYCTTPQWQNYILYTDEALSLGTVSGYPVTQYAVEGWMGERHVAISRGGSMSAHGNKLSKLLVEFDSSDKKTLSTGWVWDLGNGFTLNATEINLDNNTVFLSLAKNGMLLDDSVIDTGAGGDRRYMYTENVSGVNDVVIFSCYADAVFRGTDSNLVQLKYVYLIDNEPLEVHTDERYGNMKVTSAGSSGITLKNNAAIELDRDAEPEIMDGLHFRVADSDTVRFYPYKVYTEPGEYDVRGMIVEANDSSWIYPVGDPSNIATSYTWNPYNFAAFWYDPDDDLGSEQMTIEEICYWSNRTIAMDKLVYTTSPVPQTYALVKDGVATRLGVVGASNVTRYFVEGWNGEKYVAISKGGSWAANGNKLAKLLVEYTSNSEKKILTEDEVWNLSGEFTLTVVQIGSDGNSVVLSLDKSGVNMDESVIDISPSGDRKYMYKTELSGVRDVVVFFCYIDAVSVGTTNFVQLKYVFLIDNEPLEVHTDEQYGRMKVTSAGYSGITLRNDNSLSLSQNSEEDIMGDMSFMVADSNTVRFYPFVERTICGGAEPEPTATATATTDVDGDGVPDVWDADNSTQEGYWVNSEGIGRRWGDMNGDGVLTSVDALMILQAAADGICL